MLRGVLVIMLAASLSGCGGKQSDITVRYVIPTGYRGVLEMREDGSRGTRPEWNGNTVTYTFPANGMLKTTDLSPHNEWHTEYAEFSDGTPASLGHPKMQQNPPLSREITDNMVLYRTGVASHDSNDNRTDYILVGTEEDRIWFQSEYPRQPINLNDKSL